MQIFAGPVLEQLSPGTTTNQENSLWCKDTKGERKVGGMAVPSGRVRLIFVGCAAEVLISKDK